MNDTRLYLASCLLFVASAAILVLVVQDAVTTMIASMPSIG